MRLWLVKRIESDDGAMGADYDEFVGFVVRAPDEERARALAEDASNPWSSDRKEPYWRDPAITSCEEVPVDGDEAVILDSFRAG
jgi:hypothetical protein